MPTSPEVCAQEMLDVVPQVMRAIRAEMRRHRTADLSVPQFRTLNYLGRCPQASLSDVADYIGLTLPSASKIVEGLVARKLLSRQTDPADRRRLTLSLTRSGQTALEASRRATRACLAESLAALTEAERTTVIKAMAALRPVFAPED